MAVISEGHAAENRVALIIGNNNYNSARFGELKNAIADAKAAEVLLSRSGFTVFLEENVDFQRMDAAINRFCNAMERNGAAWFWYSGHGIQFDNKNFLIPIDVKDDTAFNIAQSSYCMDELLNKVTSKGAKTVILVLDACRDQLISELGMGIQAFVPDGSKFPKGVIGFYAASHNEQALDAPESENGLFAQQFLAHLKPSGRSVRDAFEATRRAVSQVAKKTYSRQQNPMSFGNVDFFLRPSDSESTTAAFVALPICSGHELSSSWPENLLMKVGVDRTQVLGIVAGVDVESLHDSLCYTEALLNQADPAGKFGRRSWSIIGPGAPLLKGKMGQPFGLICEVSGNVTASQIDEAIRTCMTWPEGSENSARPLAGNAVIMAFRTDEASLAPECLRLARERSAKLAFDVNCFGWIVQDASAVADLLSGRCSERTGLLPHLSQLERELIRNSREMQIASKSRDQAIEFLRKVRPNLTRDLLPLCDWVCGRISENEFFAKAKRRTFQLASSAGLLAGIGPRPTESEASRAAAIVAAAAANRELLGVLAGLPICTPVLSALVAGDPVVRMSVGLVTSDEILSVAPDWMRYPIEQWRGNRHLIFGRACGR